MRVGNGLKECSQRSGLMRDFSQSLHLLRSFLSNSQYRLMSLDTPQRRQLFSCLFSSWIVWEYHAGRRPFPRTSSKKLWSIGLTYWSLSKSSLSSLSRSQLYVYQVSLRCWLRERWECNVRRPRYVSFPRLFWSISSAERLVVTTSHQQGPLQFQWDTRVLSEQSSQLNVHLGWR